MMVHHLPHPWRSLNKAVYKLRAPQGRSLILIILVALVLPLLVQVHQVVAVLLLAAVLTPIVQAEATKKKKT